MSNQFVKRIRNFLADIGITEATCTFQPWTQDSDRGVSVKLVDFQGRSREYFVQISQGGHYALNRYLFNEFGGFYGVQHLVAGVTLASRTLAGIRADLATPLPPEAKPTVKGAIAAINALGLKAKYDSAAHEFRVAFSVEFYKNYYKLSHADAVKRQEAQAGYENDPVAAYQTAKAMSEEFQRNHAKRCA